VIDRDNTVGIYDSVADAESHLETIDVEGGEYEFCDETGQSYFGDVLKPVEKFRSGEFRIVPRGMRDPSLPASFLSRATESVPQHFERQGRRLRIGFGNANATA
jgi:hypothetical protein